MPHLNTPCDNCPAGCCRNYLVNVNAYDVFRIASALKLPIADFAELRWVNERQSDYQILLNPGGAPEEMRYHRITLRKASDPDPQYESGRCVFLVTIGGRGRCGIYPVRPGVCATYPTSYDSGLIGLSGGGKYCPPEAWQLEGVDVPAFRVKHRQRNRHRAIHDSLVDAWNEKITEAREEWSERYFFHYVLNFYRHLELRAPVLFDETTADDADAQPDMRRLVGETLRAIGWS